VRFWTAPNLTSPLAHQNPAPAAGPTRGVRHTLVKPRAAESPVQIPEWVVQTVCDSSSVCALLLTAGGLSSSARSSRSWLRGPDDNVCLTGRGALAGSKSLDLGAVAHVSIAHQRV